ncbi:MAG: hypothetical protein GY757_31525 [bacterium]|nr:hypothetical protein [bacterium]
MKKNLFIFIIIIILLAGCKKNPELQENTVTPGSESTDTGNSTLQEYFVGRMFYHDNGPQSDYDIYKAELYLVPKATASTQSQSKKLITTGIEKQLLTPGIKKFRNLEVNGLMIEKVIVDKYETTISTSNNIVIGNYDFVVRNVENLTNSTTHDFAVNVNCNNVMTFVSSEISLNVDSSKTEIFYMSVEDRVRYQITPINGNYSGQNWDPDWKTNDIITWTHDGEIVEVDINTLEVSDPLIPDVETPQYDAKYSPDGTMLLFNTRNRGKKNSYIKNLVSGQLQTVLPTAYFNAYKDDNPTWVFSNTFLSGHIFMNNGGRIFTRDLDTGAFLIITDGSRDFRYVSPIRIDETLYLVFSDWTDQGHIALWIANRNGTILRELNQTGDEPVFLAAGLPVPESEEELQEIARDYVMMFEH